MPQDLSGSIPEQLQEDLEGQLPEDMATEATESQEPQQEQPRLYAGKYRTVEEMEKAIREKDKLIGRKLTQYEYEMLKASGEYDTEQPEEQGTDEDYSTPYASPYGNPYAPTYAPTYAPAYTPQTGEQDPEALWFQSPQQAFHLSIQQVRQMEKMAQRNLRMELAKRKSDPDYDDVRDMFEAELMTVPDEMLADPRQAAYIADRIYTAVLGQRYVRLRQQTGARPDAPSPATAPQSPQPAVGGGGSTGGPQPNAAQAARMMRIAGGDPEVYKAILAEWRKERLGGGE